MGRCTRQHVRDAPATAGASLRASRVVAVHNIPAAPSDRGRHAPALGQGPRPLPARRRPPADGRQRPDLGLRLRAGLHDPRQGRDPDPDVAVVVRPARRPGAPPRASPPTCPSRSRAGRWCARSWRCTPSSASPAATSPAPACSDYQSTGEVCGVAAAQGAGRRQPAAAADLHPGHQGRARATTTRTSPSRPWSATSGPTPPRSCAT